MVPVTSAKDVMVIMVHLRVFVMLQDYTQMTEEVHLSQNYYFIFCCIASGNLPTSKFAGTTATITKKKKYNFSRFATQKYSAQLLRMTPKPELTSQCQAQWVSVNGQIRPTSLPIFLTGNYDD